MNRQEGNGNVLAFVRDFSELRQGPAFFRVCFKVSSVVFSGVGVLRGFKGFDGVLRTEQGVVCLLIKEDLI